MPRKLAIRNEVNAGAVAPQDDCIMDCCIVLVHRLHECYARWEGTKHNDVVVKIADHSETSDNMGQGMAEQAPRNLWLTE